MNKIFSFIGLFVLTLGLAQAHIFVPLKKAKSPIVEKSRASTQAFAQLLNNRYAGHWGMAFEAFKVKTFSPPKERGESRADFYARVLKSSFHQEYPVTGNEKGYNLRFVGPEADLIKSLEDVFVTDFQESEEAAHDRFIQDLKAARKSGVLIYSGTGSGNNTTAAILAIVDPRNAEIFYAIDSNFGRDK